MTNPQEQRSPHKAGNVRKLWGWARRNSNLWDVVMPLALLVLLAAAWVWQGVAR